MQEVIALVLAALPNAGDRKSYEEIYEATPESKRVHLRNALKSLKADGRVLPENTVVDGKFLYELVRQ